VSADTDALRPGRFFASMCMRPLPSILILTVLFSDCRPRSVETARAVPYSEAPDLPSTQGAPPVGAAHGKVEFEAPPLIPAMRAHLDQITRPETGDEPNVLTSYKSAATRLILAMRGDLVRVGLADSGAFKRLSDSVLKDLGGGSGLASPPTPEGHSVATGRMRRLIELYESWMRQVPS
jgi:hypothetical protein